MDYRLELVGIPVSDIDRSLAFYVDRLGFVLDHDHRVSEDLRFVQLTPPGSACSITFATGPDAPSPGSAKNLQLVVAETAAAAEDLRSRGLDPGEPQALPWGTFLFLEDPDGNAWSIQGAPYGQGG